MKITLMDGFYEYLKEMTQEASDFGFNTNGEVFDTEMIKMSLMELPGIDVTRIYSPDPKNLELDFEFADINAILEDPADQELKKVFDYKNTGNKKEFKFFLNALNYKLIEPLIPVKDNPLFDALGPQPDYLISREEYLDLVEFTMGDEGPKMVIDSDVVTTVSVNGRLLAQSGGTISQGKAVFHLPLLKVLLLLEDMDYSFQFE
jgi:hypothetical protein